MYNSRSGEPGNEAKTQEVMTYLLSPRCWRYWYNQHRPVAWLPVADNDLVICAQSMGGGEGGGKRGEGRGGKSREREEGEEGEEGRVRRVVEGQGEENSS